MTKQIKKVFSFLIVGALIAGGIQRPDLLAAEEGVTVSTPEQFMAALEQHKSPVIIAADTIISIGEEADSDTGRMLPVMIPADTVICGTQNSSLNSRSPIQLEGDVCFQNMELTFESTDALGSVPHREIFLAGHGATFDNVSTWLEGGADLGPLGGTEKELLPTVYGGGYSHTQVGENASLTVTNSNEKTMFQAIYMGHDAGSDNKVPYQGTAALNMDAGVTVRGRVDVSKNSQAQISITGGRYDHGKAKEFYGNENTCFTLSGSSVDEAVVENMGSVVVADKGCLISKTASYKNVTLQRGGCLDLNPVKEAHISGDFVGTDPVQEERGILVLNMEGRLTIEGSVTGVTQFQTENRLFPGLFYTGAPYISAYGQNISGNCFVLSDQSTDNGYELIYAENNWSVSRTDQEEFRGIGEIEIVSAPSEVNVNSIRKNEEDRIPDENVYFEIVWKDPEGNEISSEVAEEQKLYEIDYIFKIKSEYWDSDDPDIQERTDWSNPITFRTSEEHPGRYYLQAEEGAKPGKYTFLFCSDYYSGSLNTVADVKELKDWVKAECSVTFLEETPRPEPTMTPAATETPKPEPTGTPAATETPKSEPAATPVPGDKYPAEIIPQKVNLSSDVLVYTGKPRKPAVKVTDANGNTVSSEHYRLMYQNNKNVGRASVTVIFCGDLSGAITKFFDIVPKKVRAFRMIPKSNGFLVKWKKQRVQTTGYEIQYCTDRKFAKRSAKRITVKNNKTASKRIIRGMSGKKFYVRIRAYKLVRVNGKTVKFYSGWTRVRSGKETD